MNLKANTKSARLESLIKGGARGIYWRYGALRLTKTMLTLNKTIFELGENEDRLFSHLYLDTEASGITSDSDRFFRGEFGIKKAWFGEVKINNKIFELVRTRTGLLRMNISAITIKGTRKKDGKRGEFEVRYMLTLRTIINLLLMTLFFGSIAVYSSYDFWALMIVTLLWTLQILILIVDLNKTEKKFSNYLEETLGNAP